MFAATCGSCITGIDCDIMACVVTKELYQKKCFAGLTYMLQDHTMSQTDPEF